MKQGRQPQNATGQRPGRRKRRAAPVDFDLLPGLLGYNLRRAQVSVFQDFARSLEECRLTPGQFGVLVLIDANPGMNQTQLSEALRVDRSTVVTVIDRLEERGVVERAPSPDDRRSYALRLTAAGEVLLSRAKPLVLAHETRLGDGFEASELATLTTLLQRLADAR